LRFAVVALVALVAAAPVGAQVPVIANGVTIAGVEVGGLTATEATAEVRASFNELVRVSLRAGTLSVAPAKLGGRPRIGQAVSAALAAPPGATLALDVNVLNGELRAWVNHRAKAFYRAPVSAHIKRVGLRPSIVGAKPGRRLVRTIARTRLRAALVAHERSVTLSTRSIKPKVGARSVGPAVVIRRGSHRLFFYRGFSPGKMRLVASFPVAVGQPVFPTPLGSFTIRTMTRNPWWYPPDSDWAEGAEPIPPGPGNPLGTRWMGLSVAGVGIHGTYNSLSVGTSASHGCIRMHIRSAEWVFERVRIGTPVFIVGA
jgi:lipoprotein-anchoring transpeptidase ErfK/SrfK